MPHGPRSTFDVGLVVRVAGPRWRVRRTVWTKRAKTTTPRWRAAIRKDQG